MKAAPPSFACSALAVPLTVVRTRLAPASFASWIAPRRRRAVPRDVRGQELGDGKIRTTGPVSGNRDIDLGPVALLQVDNVKVAVTSKRMQALEDILIAIARVGISPILQNFLTNDFVPVCA
jgi:microcystin degradation protein MlrC